MAYDGRSLYVPVVNLGFTLHASSSKPAGKTGLPVARASSWR